MTDKKNQEEEGYSFDSSNLIFFLLSWRKPLIIVSISAAIVSSVVALLLEERYQSTVIMFPASTSSVSKSVMVSDPSGRQDIVQFGEEEQAEQMLQILNSDKIRNRIIAKYNLMEHYEIEPDEEYKLTKLNKMYEKNVSFKRTEFQSVRVDVLDKDPQTAADIANDIAAMFDTIKNEMQHERALAGLEVIKREYFEMRDYMQSMDDSLTFIREQGVVEYERQSEMLTQEYYKALAAGKTSAIRDLDEEKAILAKYGSAYLSLTENLEFEREQLATLRAKYEETLVDASEYIPHKFVVNKAWAAEKKAYPIRWLIVVVSTFAAFLLTILAIIALENISKFREYQRKNEDIATA